VATALLSLIVLLAGCQPAPPRFELTPAQQAFVDDHVLQQAPAPTHPVGAEWDDAVRFVGWRAYDPQVFPGDKVDLSLLWQSLRGVRQDWEILMRLVPADGGRPAMLDHHAVGGLHPVVRWRPGQVIDDRVAVRVPRDFSPGPATLRVGLAHWDHRRGPVDAGVIEILPPVRRIPLPPSRDRWNVGRHTQVWAQWDEDALLFGFDCRDADPYNPLRRRDDDLWTYDAIELFLTVGDSNPRYLEFQVSPSGVLFDASFGAHRSDLEVARRWTSEATAWASPAPKGWRGELVVPWNSLGGRPPEGAPILANVYRLDRDRDGSRRAYAWSGPASGDFHDRQRWGRLRLVR